MKEYFTELSKFRLDCLANEKPDSFLYQASRWHILFMTASEEVDASQLTAFFKFKNGQIKDPEYVFHYLWMLNAYARYLCFVVKDLPSAQNTVLDIAALSDPLFHYEYSHNKSEKRCLVLILALNVARLSLYSKNIELAKKQLEELRRYVELGAAVRFLYFPKQIQLIFNTWGDTIQTYLNEENQNYFLEKIRTLDARISERR